MFYSELNVGRTMVLYRAETHRTLQLNWLRVNNFYAKACQRRFNGNITRKKVTELRAHQKLLKNASDRRDLSRLEKVIRGAEHLFFKTRVHTRAIVVRDALIQETVMSKRFKKLLEKDADVYYDDYASTVQSIKEWQEKDPLSFQTSMALRIVKAYELVGERREVVAAAKDVISSIERLGN